MGEAEDLDNTAKARKRRMQRRAKQPVDDAAEPSKPKKPRMDEGASSSDEEVSPPGTLSKDELAKIPGVKQQARYVPAVKMTKAELTLWRKEARRVRNRESAAASRQKTQSRINVLEAEVGELTTKYQAALKRIVELEAQAAARDAQGESAWKPPKMMMMNTRPQHVTASPVVEPHTVSPPLSPRESFSLDEEPVAQSFSASRSAPYPHQATTTFKISRPNASVKITPVAVDNTSSATPPTLDLSSTAPPHWTAPQDTAAFLLPDAALATAAEAAANDYPLALDDNELGDFLNFAMSVEGESGVHPDRHTDALCIFEELSPPSVLMAPP
ncbi:expressed unknown protein [Seminavis robusta]|uniref:BZIP domain-containing protein n=1 Tax=Seminavis robusta TaxID=568900 RepID=A0A9N8HL53_9STRA|nr:expressed unknown protein [Seminavis robusta]|eukprot:Sro1002_g229860.1 n/a (329) ;mRNA; r:17179-18238